MNERLRFTPPPQLTKATLYPFGRHSVSRAKNYMTLAELLAQPGEANPVVSTEDGREVIIIGKQAERLSGERSVAMVPVPKLDRMQLGSVAITVTSDPDDNGATLHFNVNNEQHDMHIKRSVLTVIGGNALVSTGQGGEASGLATVQMQHGEFQFNEIVLPINSISVDQATDLADPHAALVLERDLDRKMYLIVENLQPKNSTEIIPNNQPLTPVQVGMRARRSRDRREDFIDVSPQPFTPGPVQTDINILEKDPGEAEVVLNMAVASGEKPLYGENASAAMIDPAAGVGILTRGFGPDFSIGPFGRALQSKDLARALVGIDILGINISLADSLAAIPSHIQDPRVVQDTLLAAMEEVNQAISDEQLNGLTATALAFKVVNGMLVAAGAGDATLYVLRPGTRNTPALLTQLNQPQGAVRVAYLREEGVNLSNISAGDRNFIRTELDSRPVQTKDDGQSIRLSSSLYYDLRRLENEGKDILDGLNTVVAAAPENKEKVKQVIVRLYEAIEEAKGFSYGLGVEENVIVDSSAMPVQKGDIIVALPKGVVDNLSNQPLVDTLVAVQATYPRNLKAQAEDLIRRAGLGKNQEDAMVLLAEVV